MTELADAAAVKQDDQHLIDAGLQAVERAMFNAVNSEVDILRDASRHILSAGGKRIRPRLLMAAYLATGGTDIEYAAPPAAAVELMHTASVVHDDINDHGVLRRGRPSVNAIWGRTFALLTGDFLFTAVYQVMSPYKDLNMLLSRAATALVEGETLQAAAVKNNNFTREVYARIIALKTAALFESAAEIGAKLGHATREQVTALSQFGHNIGLAFQIMDDILDIVGDEARLGKTAGIDLEQGRGFGAVKEAAAGAAPAADPMESLKRRIMSGNYLREAEQQAEALVQMAISLLDVLPDSAAREELITLAWLTIRRDY
ncbi:MAG: polyprenyl synthetase family protein [Anaerolineae bacterium]|jgi:geranylgeranyl pyrophosphate synthase|nr:polyprenyl synthetase family protein [Anaerolineae bacterium]